MKRETGLLWLLSLTIACWISPTVAEDAAQVIESTKTRQQIVTEVERMYVEDVAWRSIPWKTCLLDGIRESRKQNKPILLWVFIDRPIDDERC
ncbi:MAG: hypothetical protein ACI9G1_001240 [Pirellulaceae bacterium]|jgi:hypothetical protein